MWILVFVLIGADETQNQREWILSRLILDKGFTAQRLSVVEQRLARMSPNQIEEIVSAYKDQQEQIRRNKKQTYEEATENLEMAKAYRDYLARKYQFQIGIKRKEVDLMRQDTNWLNYNLHSGYYPRSY